MTQSEQSTAPEKTPETALEDTATPASASSEEVAKVIADLEQYRERLIEDFTNTAKKAKLPKSMVMAQLDKHPEILKIDASLAKLRGEESATN